MGSQSFYIEKFDTDEIGAGFGCRQNQADDLRWRLFHIFFRLYSRIRSRLGVMVAHFACHAVPYSRLRESMSHWSSVLSRFAGLES